MVWMLIIGSLILVWVISLFKVILQSQSNSPSKDQLFAKGRDVKKRNVLLVIAHPDDESMFFTPTINFLTSRGHNVHILCLSIGDADRKGQIRKHELYQACAVLKVPIQQVMAVDHPNLQDGFGKVWDHNLLAKIVEQEMSSHCIDLVITFDNYGVSGHCNHQDVHYGVRKSLCAVAEGDIEAWELISTNIMRKYCGPVDIWLSMLSTMQEASGTMHCMVIERYGKVDRVDMKSGFAFVYMEDERDADYAIRRLDRTEFGRKGRRLRVEWTKQERDSRRGGDSRKPAANMKPSKTLFVINFDPVHTRTRDIERHFDAYGKIANIRIRRNFAFVQYDNQEDATRALEATNMSKLLDRVITVEYAIRDDDDDRRNGHSPDRRGRDLSPDGRGYGHGRSPSPYRRRGSTDYVRGSNPSSRLEARRSPKYDRGESPVNRRYDSRSPPPRGRSRS